jgi:hypothetical protein
MASTSAFGGGVRLFMAAAVVYDATIPAGVLSSTVVAAFAPWHAPHLVV